MEESIERVMRELEPLRLKIYELERRLSKYGLDPRRGIESYKISEIRELLARQRYNREFQELLLELIETQEALYRKLYEIAGLRELNVDTDSPEKHLFSIKERVTGKSPISNTHVSKFEVALRRVLEVLEKSGVELSKEDVLRALREVYKRDYDRHRVLVYILKRCRNLIPEREVDFRDLESKPLSQLADLLVLCVSLLGKERVVKVIKRG